MIAVRVGYIDDAESKAALSLAQEVGRMINGLSRSLGRQN
jgi:hypothetical protein